MPPRSMAAKNPVTGQVMSSLPVTQGASAEGAGEMSIQAHMAPVELRSGNASTSFVPASAFTLSRRDPHTIPIPEPSTREVRRTAKNTPGPKQRNSEPEQRIIIHIGIAGSLASFLKAVSPPLRLSVRDSAIIITR